MSDKMLMEDWRKYLVEAYEPGKDKRFDYVEKWIGEHIRQAEYEREMARVREN